MTAYLWQGHDVVHVDEAPLPAGPGRFETLRVCYGRPFHAPQHVRRLLGDAADERAAAEACLSSLCRAPSVDAWPLARCRLVWNGSVHGSIQPEPVPQEARVRLAWAQVRLPCRPAQKTLPHEPYLTQRQRARQAGCAEAVFQNDAGRVADTSTANIFARRGDRLFAPGPAEGALDGLTRRWVLAWLAKQGAELTISEQLDIRDLMDADEVWISSSVQGVRHISHVDGAAVGGHPGPWSQALRTAYEEASR